MPTRAARGRLDVDASRPVHSDEQVVDQYLLGQHTPKGLQLKPPSLLFIYAGWCGFSQVAQQAPRHGLRKGKRRRPSPLWLKGCTALEFSCCHQLIDISKLSSRLFVAYS